MPAAQPLQIANLNQPELNKANRFIYFGKTAGLLRLNLSSGVYFYGLCWERYFLRFGKKVTKKQTLLKSSKLAKFIRLIVQTRLRLKQCTILNAHFIKQANEVFQRGMEVPS
ncbi:hypothetical protein [Thiomicrorhabdus chilensis]|uniref:hypothetical protein n=1 Tax=Thiomicrorhabdus chilensis TaxID=63656 RepID=UPI0003FE8E27|nr:hypothetical protein [Thiomicrorhabdus chilensis]